jgi:hypothetical protein
VVNNQNLSDAQNLLTRAANLAANLYPDANAEGRAEINTFISLLRQASNKLEAIDDLLGGSNARRHYSS